MHLSVFYVLSCLVDMDAVSSSGECSGFKGQVVGGLYARWSASHRTRTFLIRARREVFLHCSYANDESFSDAVHGSYPVQQNI